MKLLIQPGEGVESLLDAINRAETCIDVAIFRFDFASIEDALTDAVKRGVLVRTLIAHVNGTSAEALRKLEMRLLAGGVTVARTDTNLARYHSKYLIVDRRELFVLAFNFTHQDIEKSRAFGIVTKNRELVDEGLALFEADTKRQLYKSKSNSFIVSPVNARKQLTAFIKGAKEELAIYDPRLTDPAMLRLLSERLKANVSVRIIGRASEKASQDLVIRHLAKLRLHTRTIVRDRKAVFVGSQSLRTLELDGRRELGIICRDRAVVAGIIGVFEEDWTASEHEPIRAIHPIAKVAKKVAKLVSTELPSVIPVLNGVVKEISNDGAGIKLVPEELEETVQAAVKEAVRTVVQEAIENNIEQNGGTGA